ncbi:syntaxin-19 isoform X1 [Oreochromis aureus]|uniref:t-SNARE coiled-coil homology domain-containing protein n=1 Tax=Oreochromis aureus TaxID=47969 RepID=A0A668VYI3_OREAU|nr:syntaxin-19 isoform X1 [Oreochromis aureus]XP_039456423.1 syntaxin-19 isoform X1 [Oreochromis aureus]XP_039456424.1 syntaxin-19 isoform X1 [Oreochromis aureus]
MRDRLVELQQKARELSAVATENINPFSVENDDDDSVALGVIKPQAVVFEEEPVIQDFLSEVEHIQDDIAVLETEVLKFTQQQKTMVATMRRFSVMKKESSITRDIKLRAESLHRRLDNLSKQVQKTLEQQGPTAALTRIQSSQHAALLRRFQQVMREYNEGLLTKQDRCKQFIIRQLEVSEKPVTEKEVDEMVATGNWEVFNENLLNDVRITRAQLSEIEQRHKELMSLENNMKELRDLFMDIFMLVEEQGVFIEHIQTNVEMTQDYVVASNEKFKAAARYKKKNPIRQLCCCCCPPWRCCL